MGLEYLNALTHLMAILNRILVNFLLKKGSPIICCLLVLKLTLIRIKILGTVFLLAQFSEYAVTESDLVKKTGYDN
jgi:hypothetical protein